MLKLKTLIDDLNGLVLKGKAMDAFEKYYADGVIMQENLNPPTIGKNLNRAREEEFFSNITELRKIECGEVAVGDNVTMVVWHYDYTHREGGLRNYTQVSVQHWKDDKIIKEQFFYGS